MGSRPLLGFLGFPLLSVLTLAGCAPVSQPRASIEVTSSVEGTVIVNHGSGYVLQIPKELHVWGSKKFFSTIAPPPAGEFPIYQLTRAEDYDVEIFAPATPCTPERLGNDVVQTIPNVGEKTLWTKMPLLDAHNAFQDTYCRVATGDCSFQEMFDGTCNTEETTYAFCSQKDARTVVMCITEKKNNPALAKQIFETFRWTK